MCLWGVHVSEGLERYCILLSLKTRKDKAQTFILQGRNLTRRWMIKLMFLMRHRWKMTPDSSFTWLEGHLTEQHPKVTEVETTFDCAGGAVAEWHGDKACGLAHAVYSWPKGHRVGLPVWFWPEVTAGLFEHSHPSAVHIVTVNLWRWTWERHP